jgi:hypothetical protein
MLKDFSASASRWLSYAVAGASKAGAIKDAKGVLRILLGVLAAANLVAAWMYLWPIGGGPVELRQEVDALHRQVADRRTTVAQMRDLASKVTIAKSEGDKFLDDYFISRRVLASTIDSELISAAESAGVTPRDQANSIEPIEGSDDLSMETITANFEGTYPQLIHLINRLDRSKLLLIIDSLQATPQQGTGKLSIGLKLDAFVREDTP